MNEEPGTARKPKHLYETNGTSKTQGRIAALAACLAIGWICWSGEGVARAQTPPANLSPALLDVVKLAQNHLSDDIIIAQIKNSGTIYSLSADDIFISTAREYRKMSLPRCNKPGWLLPRCPAFPRLRPRSIRRLPRQFRQRPRLTWRPSRRRVGDQHELFSGDTQPLWNLWICLLTAWFGDPNDAAIPGGGLISTMAIGSTPTRDGSGNPNFPTETSSSIMAVGCGIFAPDGSGFPAMIGRRPGFRGGTPTGLPAGRHCRPPPSLKWASV